MYPNATVIELMYFCKFVFHEDEESFVTLSTQSKHLIHHSNNNTTAEIDVAICLCQSSENLKYTVPETGLNLDGSVNIGEPLPLQTP